MKIAYLHTLGKTLISIRVGGKEIFRSEFPAGAKVCCTFEEQVFEAIIFEVKDSGEEGS